MDSLPSLNKAYSIVIWEERHRIVARGRDEKIEAVAFGAQTNEKQSLHFSICWKIGHLAKHCYHVAGYLDWWSKNINFTTGGRGRGSGGGRIGCGHGHGMNRGGRSGGGPLMSPLFSHNNRNSRKQQLPLVSHSNSNSCEQQRHPSLQLHSPAQTHPMEVGMGETAIGLDRSRLEVSWIALQFLQRLLSMAQQMETTDRTPLSPLCLLAQLVYANSLLV